MVQTREDYNEYMRVYMLRRYHERRARSIAYLGGRCTQCGTTDDLEIDHIDPALKTLKLSNLWSCSEKRYFEELQLCQLLCVEHHKQKSIAARSVEHGGGLTGKRNCYCAKCKPLKREYQRKARASRRILVAKETDF